MKPWIILAAMLSACGADPDFVTDLGIEVQAGGHDVRAYELDAAVRTFLSHARKYAKISEADVAGLRIVFQDDDVECTGPGEAAGCYHYAFNGLGLTHTITLKWYGPCLVENELMHELNHWAEKVSGRDRGHKDYDFFFCPDSVQGLSNAEVCEEQCGGECGVMSTYTCPWRS